MSTGHVPNPTSPEVRAATVTKQVHRSAEAPARAPVEAHEGAHTLEPAEPWPAVQTNGSGELCAPSCPQLLHRGHKGPHPEKQSGHANPHASQGSIEGRLT
eukprot:6454774-Amphidinium_carterae.1